MTDQTDIYTELKQGEYQAPSIYLAAIKNRLTATDPETIRRRLEKVLQRDDVDEIIAVEACEDGFTNIALRSIDEDEPENELVSLFRIRIYDNDEPEAWAYEAADYRNRNLLEDERAEMHQATQILECFTYLDADFAQSNWMLQFAVIDAVAGECYALQDMVSSQFFSGTWLAEMAQTYTPPSLEMAYVLHVVVPEDESKADFWMHTHGLLKFSLPELEIMRAGRLNIEIYQGIINSVSQSMLDNPEIWHEDEAILCANTEAGELSVRLMPWQDALRSDLLAPMKKGLFKQKIERFSGDLGEREADDIHTEPSLVIFGDKNGQAVHLSDFGAAVEEGSHIMLMLPNSETWRMYCLAKEKLPLFSGCLNRHPPQEGVWGYMMKIRCESESTQATEHMWFIVQSISGDSVTAELVNDPFDIPEMHSGQSYTLPLEQVTDWCIYSKPLQARITPDDVFRLRRYLNAN